MRNLVVMVLLSCSLIGFFGCASAAKQGLSPKDSTLLEPETTLKFVDVPVPVGFKPIAQASYSFESSGVRVGLLKYEGKANVDLVVNFYKEQMPMFNWSLLNVVEYGERLLNFERENETCIVNLMPKGGKVTVTISLGPKSQSLSRKAEKPVK